MNAKQSLRAASRRIEELENYNQRASADIKAYNLVIDSLLAGGDPCDWCEDHGECSRDDWHGCTDWMLAYKAETLRDTADDNIPSWHLSMTGAAADGDICEAPLKEDDE